MINAPWFSDNVEKLAFNAWAMRTSGLEEAAHDFVNHFNNGEDINDPDIQEEILDSYDLNDLNSDEKDYLLSLVEKNLHT